MDGEFRQQSIATKDAPSVSTSHLTAEQALKLVRSLASDDAFRSRVLSDPSAAVEMLGLPKAFVACLAKVRTLPSKEVLANCELALVTDLTCLGTQQVIGLNAS